jgi:hypothetical protein
VGLGGGVFQCGRGERGGEWCGMLRGRRCSFIGAVGGRRATIMASIGGETGGSVNGDLSALKFRFKGQGGG